jgi:hypothetical protein
MVPVLDQMLPTVSNVFRMPIVTTTTLVSVIPTGLATIALYDSTWMLAIQYVITDMDAQTPHAKGVWSVTTTRSVTSMEHVSVRMDIKATTVTRTMDHAMLDAAMIMMNQPTASDQTLATVMYVLSTHIWLTRNVYATSFGKAMLVTSTMPHATQSVQMDAMGQTHATVSLASNTLS